MAEFRQGVLTTKGLALLAKAQAGLCNITFTKFQIGNGSWPASVTQETMMAATSLRNRKAEFPVSRAEYVNNATSRLTLVASNSSNVSGGYYITEVGVWATDGSTEVLYALYLASTPDWFPAYNSITPSSLTYSGYITVANASSVTVNNASASLVTREDMETEDDLILADLWDSVSLLVNAHRQHVWDFEDEKAVREANDAGLMLMEKGTVTLTNTQEFPFNDSQRSVALTKNRASTDYIVTVISAIAQGGGNIGEIEVSDRLVNGFKMAHTGSASSVTVTYMVSGGFGI